MTGAGDGIDRLSARQLEILELVAKGLTNPEIAEVLRISPATVRTHVGQVLARLELSNRTEAAAAYVAWAACPQQIAAVLDRPAIAVLPVEANDDEPATRAVAWGFTHDIAALFARWCWFPVITPPARSGAEGPGRGLRARFIVAAALRTATRPWRLSVRIVDAEGGGWLWTDRYDFSPEELYSVQDSVCASIVANAYPVMVAHTEVSLRRRVGACDLSAWEMAHHGMRIQAARASGTRATAQASFSAAIEREPDLVLAHFGLGLCSFDAVLNQSGPREEAREQLYACAQRCIALAPHGAEGYYLLARYAQSSGEHDLATLMLETAIARNPSFAAGHALLAQVLQLVGRSDEALTRMRDATRLDGRSFVAGMATLLFARGEYPEALAAAEEAVITAPRYAYARVVAAASAWWSREPARAIGHVTALRALSPNFTIASFEQAFGATNDAVMRVSRALRAIGVGS
ncbi:MAG: tetratricopeptide repeat protein [Myxococcales bacterium]|nr:tetratricopeptide repeat protein [Myxococcales bacterium]